eukprot:6374597-Prymnesium_polylepis.1
MYRSGSATRASPTASESGEVWSFAAALTQCSDRTAVHEPRGARGSARCTIRRKPVEYSGFRRRMSGLPLKDTTVLAGGANKIK